MKRQIIHRELLNKHYSEWNAWLTELIGHGITQGQASDGFDSTEDNEKVWWGRYDNHAVPSIVAMRKRCPRSAASQVRRREARGAVAAGRRTWAKAPGWPAERGRCSHVKGHDGRRRAGRGMATRRRGRTSGQARVPAAWHAQQEK